MFTLRLAMIAHQLAMDTTSCLAFQFKLFHSCSIMFIVHAKPVDGAYFWNEFVVTVTYLCDGDHIKLQLEQHTGTE
jgi:hypothetical protein